MRSNVSSSYVPKRVMTVYSQEFIIKDNAHKTAKHGLYYSVHNVQKNTELAKLQMFHELSYTISET